jgi:hypothetical protein
MGKHNQGFVIAGYFSAEAGACSVDAAGLNGPLHCDISITKAKTRAKANIAVTVNFLLSPSWSNSCEDILVVLVN